MTNDTLRQNAIESTHSTPTKPKGTIHACPVCGRISPGERFVRSHWTHQHVEALGEFPGAEIVTIGGIS